MKETPSAIVLNRFLYLAADQLTIVEEGDARAKYVLGGPGSTIPAKEAERVKLAEYLVTPPAPEVPPAEGAVDEPVPPPKPKPGPKSTRPLVDKATYPGEDK